MSPLTSPVDRITSAKTGTSISTPLVVPSPRRTTGDWAKPTTAPSSFTTLASWWVAVLLQVVGVGFVGRVGLAGGTEVVDVLHRRAPFRAGLPGRPHPHAHPDLGRVTAQDQVLERDV